MEPISNFDENNTLTYLIMISSDEQKHQAEILINSIRRFGGEYSNSPVMILNASPLAVNCESLAGIADWIVELEMPESLRSFPFADKVYACSQAEKIVENLTDWLLWITPDALIVKPPEDIVSKNGAWVSLRPVHAQNVWIDYIKAQNDYRKKMYSLTNNEAGSFWTNKSYVDNKITQLYFNPGCMAFRTEKGILSDWKDLFEYILNDDVIHSYYMKNEYEALFFHQIVLNAVIESGIGNDKINFLPLSYGYPLSQQSRQDFPNKLCCIDEMNIILCEDYNNLNKLVMGETYSSWLNTMLPNGVKQDNLLTVQKML